MSNQQRALPKEEQPLEPDFYFSRAQQDVLGEMGNICMGTAATALNALLDFKVIITTPKLAIHTWKSLASEHRDPLVVVAVQYTSGVEGSNILLLKDYDVALITDRLMGVDTPQDHKNVVLNDDHLSCIREVMNQMVGASATSLASMLNMAVNISTPISSYETIREQRLKTLIPEEPLLLKISFKMEIMGLLSSEIMQVLPVGFARALADKMLG
ncbi:chemotaxis protein CheC [Eubacteriales bacterium OttesenSCG-928-K08]|nr:chemotaxis protein CheC [Eubacteriales bacterium OttesenSCG-928-K08]